MLEAYDLNAGDVIRVDNGTYNLSANLIVGNADSGVAIEGYHDAGYPDRRALIDRGNTNAGSYAIELQDADRVTLDRLHVIGGYYGVFAGNGAGSDDLLGDRVILYNNSSANISIGTGNSRGVMITGSQVFYTPVFHVGDGHQFGRRRRGHFRKPRVRQRQRD